MRSELDNKAVIFYDGDCALCNFFVQFLIKNDAQKKFLFASQQHPKSVALLNKQYLEGESVVLFLRGEIYTKSTAALNALKELGGWWKLISIFKIIPQKIRDSIYDFIARNRKKWFGSTNYCRMPDQTLNF